MHNTPRIKIFDPDLEAVFVSRPNRFLVIADSDGKLIAAHCPNPGRLNEILFPGTPLLLSRAPAGPRYGPARKTMFTLEAARHRGKLIPLYSGRANLIAERLVIPHLFPDAVRVVPEYPYGRSRFDFLIETPERRIFLEVKACTLCEYGIASFPDAPTLRGTRHLMELAEISQGGKSPSAQDPSPQAAFPELPAEGHVLFILMHEDAAVFVPAIHTDPLFSETLLHAKKYIGVHSVSVSAGEDGCVGVCNPEVPQRYGPVDLVLRNTGIYCLLCEVRKTLILDIGSLGARTLEAGFYAYAGSALGIMKTRVSRHLSKHKQPRWHVDYLTLSADSVRAYPIYTDKPLECALALKLSQIAEGSVKGFGCGDCTCKSHLYYFKNEPLRMRAFMDVLMHFRYGVMKEDLAATI